MVDNNQSINTVFGLLIIVFLTAVLLVGNTKGGQKVENDPNDISLSFLLQRRNDKVKHLSTQLAAKQIEAGSLRDELASLKADLDSANQRLSRLMTAVPEAK